MFAGTLSGAVLTIFSEGRLVAHLRDDSDCDPPRRICKVAASGHPGGPSRPWSAQTPTEPGHLAVAHSTFIVNTAVAITATPRGERCEVPVTVREPADLHLSLRGSAVLEPTDGEFASTRIKSPV